MNRISLVLLAWLLAETAGLVAMGQFFGVGATVLWLAVAMVGGLWLVQSRGLATARRAQAQLAQGTMPAAALMDGLAGVVAGLLLIVPGPVSDVVAALLLAPPVRRALMLRVLPGWLGATAGVTSPRRSGPERGSVIDGESRRVPD